MASRPEWMVGEDLKQLKNQKCQDSLEAEKMKMERNAELRNLERRYRAEQAEAELEEFLAKEKACALESTAYWEDTEKSIELTKSLHREALKERKLRQQVKESSVELKILLEKLRRAYVSKELDVQIREQRAAAVQEKLKQHMIRQAAEAERSLMKEQEKERQRAIQASKISYRMELQNQIMDQQRGNYEEFLKEKALIDKNVRAMHEEEQRDKEKRMELMMEIKHDIEEFCREKEIWKLREKEAMEQEDRKIKEYLEKREKEEKEKLLTAKDKEQIMKKVQEELMASLISQSERKKEREEVLAELAVEERREKEMKKVRQEIEETERKRQELQKSYKEQMEKRRKQIQEEKEKALELEKKMMQSQHHFFVPHSEIEKQRKKKHYHVAVESPMMINQIDLDQREKKMEESRKEEENLRKKLIEEERLRLLKTHATHLLGYLPRGVLQEDDLPHLGSEFLEEYNNHKAKSELFNNYN